MQIPAYNEFRFIGTCYNDATRVYDKNNKPKCYITLAVKSPNKKETNHIPIIAFGDLAERASIICRNGAKVCIAGYITTAETIDRLNGEIKVRTFFYAMDIMRISRPKRRNVLLKKYSDLMELASIEPYELPKQRNK